MTDPLRRPESETGNEPDAAGPPGVPRWVMVSGLVVAVLVLALVAIMLIVGGDHGPGRHASGERPTMQIEQRAQPGEPSRDHRSSSRGGVG